MRLKRRPHDGPNIHLERDDLFDGLGSQDCQNAFWLDYSQNMRVVITYGDWKGKPAHALARLIVAVVLWPGSSSASRILPP